MSRPVLHNFDHVPIASDRDDDRIALLSASLVDGCDWPPFRSPGMCCPCKGPGARAHNFFPRCNDRHAVALRAKSDRN
jgi:hypothetical protein